MEGFDDDDERASVDGPVSANTTYGDWLKTQPDDVVRDILGPARFALYKSGMPITSFVTDGRTMNLDELAEKEGITLASMSDSEDATLAIKIDRGNVDYSHLSYEDAVHKEAQWLNENGREYGREFGSIISHDNRVLGTWMGTKTTVNISDQEFRNATRGISFVDFLHTHLDGTLFSEKDMNTMCRNIKLDKVMVSLPNNDVYYLTVNTGERPLYKTIKFTYKTLYSHYKFDEKTHLPNQETDIIIRVVDMMKDLFRWDGNII
jgi:hypothetical protein